METNSTMQRKYIVITGVSTGIGYELADKLSREGYYIIGTVRQALQGETLRKNLTDNFDYVLLDLEDESSLDSFADRIVEKLEGNGIFCLINNAGAAMGGPMMLLSYEQLHRQMAINFYSIFRVSNALLPWLGAGFQSDYPPGLIINISSVSGIFNTPFLGPYCISKHAVESMSDIYRRELAIFGIKLVVIQPGPLKTPIWGKSVPKENPYINTDFETVYHELSSQIERAEKSALPVERISKLVMSILQKKNPRNRYLLTRNNTLIKMIHLLFPEKWMDRLFIKKFKKAAEFSFRKMNERFRQNG